MQSILADLAARDFVFSARACKEITCSINFKKQRPNSPFFFEKEQVISLRRLISPGRDKCDEPGTIVGAAIFLFIRMNEGEHMTDRTVNRKRDNAASDLELPKCEIV